jgi:Putative Ig domain
VRKLRVLSSVAVGILVWTLVFAGCSGSSSLTVTLAPASGQTLNPGATVTITATLTNDRNNQGVTWTLSGPGALSANTTTSVVYTAPPTISTNTTATITATSVANSSVTATESITLNAVLTITTTSLPAGALGVPYGPTFVSAAGATGTFTWTITSGTLPAGLTFLTTSTSSSAQISGTPTLIETSKFTVQVTDSAGVSVTQALSITINPPPPLSVATGSLPNGMVNTSYTATLQASSGVQPYTWSLTTGSLPFGLSLAPSGTISGTPVATGTFSFTVKVVDSSTPQQSATANLSITINQGVTDNSKLNGHYAFSVRGFDINGLFVAAGSFVADGNANISSGVMDINDTGGLPPVNETFSGTYLIGQDGLGYMTFNVLTGGMGSRAFEFSMMSGGNANIIEFDDIGGFANNTARNSGVLMRQDPLAFTGAPAVGNYAFGFAGIDSSKSRFGVAGSFHSDGIGGLSSIALDSDDAGTLFSGSNLSGSSTAVDSSGRGTITLPTPHGSAIYSFYVVTATELLVVGIDTFAPGGNPLVSGTILQQTSGSDFTAASVFELTALNSSIAESQVGQFLAVTGNFTLTSDENLGGTLSQPSGMGGYTITQPSGRVSLGGTGFQNSQPVLYLVNSNNVEAFIIGTDPAVSFGVMTTQQSGASLSGTYAGGSLAPVDPAVSNVVSIAIAGSNTLIVSQDVSGPNGLSFSGQVSETTTPPDAHGRVVVTENTNTTEILYLVSPTEFFALDALSTDPTARVDIFQQ